MAKDLMFQDDIKDAVRRAYSSIGTGGGEAVAGRFYHDEELAEIPAGAIEWSLSVGNPVRYAMLRPGETVLDVGSGGGIDTILAARRVGPGGRAIGLDILEEMGERGRRHAVEAGVQEWTEFVRGEMEDIPLPDDSVDVVISNGVLNLSARKSRALAEIFRVLEPGGRISLSDLTVEGELPPEVANDQGAWAG
ncbi:MAG TPA: methyltransferase domain-containing protein [Actinomycetota bacterium]|nr:methyltransferase domain-containing protein [Actinomycetota bacterium]